MSKFWCVNISTPPCQKQLTVHHRIRLYHRRQVHISWSPRPHKKYLGFWSGIGHQHFRYWHEGQPEVFERKKKEMWKVLTEKQIILWMETFAQFVPFQASWSCLIGFILSLLTLTSTYALPQRKSPPPPSDTRNRKQQTYLNGTHHLTAYSTRNARDHYVLTGSTNMYGRGLVCDSSPRPWSSCCWLNVISCQEP